MTSQVLVDGRYKLYIYILIYALILLPVVLWPIADIIGFQLSEASLVGSGWFLYTVVVIVVVSLGDSLLSSTLTVLERIFWVLCIVAAMAFEMFFYGSIYLLGSMFSFHSIRSAALLWRGDEGWWLWPAWIRDGGVAILLYVWLIQDSL